MEAVPGKGKKANPHPDGRKQNKKTKKKSTTSICYSLTPREGGKDSEPINSPSHRGKERRSAKKKKKTSLGLHYSCDAEGKKRKNSGPPRDDSM